jgi:pilus assembly protein Flp/PilA
VGEAGANDEWFIRAPLARASKERRMQHVLVAISRLAHDEGAQDLLEYALLVVLIAIVALGAVTTVGTTINTIFWQVIAQATQSL